MAYQIGRTKRLQEPLELIDDDGNVAETLMVDLDPDRVAMDINKAYNNIIRAQLTAQKAQTAYREEGGDSDGGTGQMVQALEAYGQSVIDLLTLIFGEDNTARLMEFYNNHITEIVTQVLPFVTDVIMPGMKRATEQLRADAAHNFKAGQAAKFGLSRQQRRRLGL